ncbi:MAG: two-component regulator propeller domain-containing protein [Bacteroidota bacterium]|nr:two-component regulator propeller domain-containing protein [Bacteroidota bacterium]
MKKLTYLIIFLAIHLCVFAQNQTQFAHYSVREGLSEINVLSMMQDHKGQMWFGTFDGLNKFNGYIFKTYKGNPGQNFSLVNYRIDRIKEDHEGYLWLQTYDGRIYRFDPKTESFLQIPQCMEDFKDYKLPIKNISILNDGSIWLSSDDDGCFRIKNSETREKVDIVHYNTSNGLLSNNHVNKVFQDKSQNTWILTANGLNLLKQNATKPVQLFTEKIAGGILSISENGPFIWIGGEHGKLRMYDNRKGSFDGIMTPILSGIIDIHQVSKDELFLLTDKSGFLLYNSKTQQFTSFNKSNNSGVKSDNFFSCYLDKKHNLWLETDNPSVVYFESAKRKVNNFDVFVDNSAPFAVLPNFFVLEDKQGNTWVHPRSGGFSRYNAITNKLEYFYNDPNSEDRKFSNVMHSAYSDSQGNLWLCPYSHGIEKVVFRKSLFTFYKPVPEKLSSAKNEIRSIYQDKDNWLWVGSKNGYMYLYDQNRKLAGRLGADGRINSANPLKASVYGITSDHSGTIWLASKGMGLFKVIKKSAGNNPTFEITNYQYNPDDIYSLSSNAAYSVFEDHLQRIWIATFGGGINLLENTNGQIRFISSRNKLKNYPIQQCNKTRYITEDKKGQLFVGTTGGLLAFRCDNRRPESIVFNQYTHDPKVKSTISGNDVHYVLPAKDGKLYLAIFGGGLDVVTEGFNLNKQPNFRAYMKENGAPSNVIFTLKEDAKGYIWFSTQTEIGKFIPQDGTFDTYNPVNPNAYSFMEATACKTRVGELAYGTTEGFVVFNPLKAIKSKYVPRIILTQLQLFNKTMEVGVEGSPLKQVIDDTEELELSHEQNIFSIGFAALDYTDPQNIQYAYKLDGFEKEWNYVGDLRTATYTNLPKGEYTFRVKSTNSDGVWVENERVIKIVKLPSFWESSWGTLFFLLLFLGITGLAAFILFTIYRLKNEVEVEHRITNMKLRFFTDISHELRTPLTLIASPVENILKHESLSDAVKDQLTVVHRNTERMLRLINQILDFRKIQNKKMKLMIEEIHTGSYVNEICESFRKLAEERKIHFEVHDDSNDASLWVDKDKFEKILFNLLSNAFKFTQPGNPIGVIISEENDTVSITVRDQGTGMSKDRLKLLFNRFESLASANVSSFQPGTGIGLSLTKELVEMHQAKIEVESEPGKGSSFKVTFLKGYEHFAENEDFVLQDMLKSEPDNTESVAETVYEEEEAIVEESATPERQTILIAEDNQELRLFLKSILSHQYDILEAENGLEALDMAKSTIPDLIISDIMMPEMTGLELAKAIKEDINISHIPLVLLTAKTDMDSKLEALQYGADDYITKPFSSAYLEARVENLLKLRKQLQELYRSSLTSGVISPSKPNVVSQDDIFIQKIMKFIEDNIDNSELTIEEIVSSVGFSRSAFFKKLKSLTGLAPVEFLKEVRVQRASQLIETGEFNISQITYMVGMSDPRYFSRCFKQKFGMSPREYKEKCNSSQNKQ